MGVFKIVFDNTERGRRLRKHWQENEPTEIVGIFSSQKAHRTKNTQMSEDNFRGERDKLVPGPRWWPDTRTALPAGRQS
jgi:hypothetical protein